MSVPRAVVVTRPTELEELLARHGTKEQARFFLERRRQTIAEVEERHHGFLAVLARVSGGIPLKWRRSSIKRADLPRFLFEPADLVIVVGQDGLVPNVAKYLDGQIVLGVNPAPKLFDGVLVKHAAPAVAELAPAAIAGATRIEERTMVEASLDDGQRLLALNEIFVGHRTHQSSRYRLRVGENEERQSSSGIVVTTGTGATGWARSIARERKRVPDLPAPGEPALAFFVREAFPSVSTGTGITAGRLEGERALEVTSEMGDEGVVFGDGIEDDRLRFGWGLRARVRVAQQRLRLVA